VSNSRLGGCLVATSRQDSRVAAMGYRAPRPADPRIWGPERQTWPDKVALVSYGTYANYVGPVDLRDYKGSRTMTVGRPEGLVEWASAQNVRMQTSCFMLS